MGVRPLNCGIARTCVANKNFIDQYYSFCIEKNHKYLKPNIYAYCVTLLRLLKIIFMFR